MANDRKCHCFWESQSFESILQFVAKTLKTSKLLILLKIQVHPTPSLRDFLQWYIYPCLVLVLMYVLQLRGCMGPNEQHQPRLILTLSQQLNSSGLNNGTKLQLFLQMAHYRCHFYHVNINFVLHLLFIIQSVLTLFLTHLKYSKPILTSCFNALHLLPLFSTPPLLLSKLCSEALTLKNFNCIPQLMFLTVKTQEHMLYHYHKF